MGVKSTTVEVTVKDATKPEISTAEATSLKTIVVTFSEDVKQAETFSVTLNDEALPEGITASVEGKTLTITSSDEFASGDYKIAFTGLTDLAGNDFAEGKNTTTVSIDAESYKAEEAVKAYEAAEVTNYLSYAKAEELKEAAEDAVKKVTDADAKKTFTDRITEKDTAVAEIVDPKVKAVNEAASQAALLTALNDFFDDADQANIVDYQTKLTEGNGKYTADDIQKKVVYEANFMAKFNDAVVVGEVTGATGAIVTSTTVNEFKLLDALNYGQEKGLLTGVVESRLSAYVTSAKKFYNGVGSTSVTPTVYYAKSASEVQTNLINSSVEDILKKAGKAFKAAKDDPATEDGTTTLTAAGYTGSTITDVIEYAESVTSTVPKDIVVPASLTTDSGLEAGDNAYEAYAKGIADLKRVKAVMKALNVQSGTVNQANLLKVLKEQGFERVIDDYVTDYIDGVTVATGNTGNGTGVVGNLTAVKTKLFKSKTASGGETTNITVTDIQKKIDKINDAKADMAVRTASDTSTKDNVEKAAAAIALIQDDYPKTETESARTTKADLQKILDEAKVNIDVTEALGKIDKWTADTTTITMKKDLKALSDSEASKEKPDFDYAIVNDSNTKVLDVIKKYVVANNTPGSDSKTTPNTAKGIQDIVKQAVMDKIVGKAVQSATTGRGEIAATDGWKKENTPTLASEVKEDLVSLAKSVSKDTAPGFTLDNVDTTDRALLSIRDTVVTNKTTDNITDASDVAKEIYIAAVAKIAGWATETPDPKDIKADLVTLEKATSTETTDANKFSMDIVDTSDAALTAIKDEMAKTDKTDTTQSLSAIAANNVITGTTSTVTNINDKIKEAAIRKVSEWSAATDPETVKTDLKTVSKTLSKESKPAFSYDSVDEQYITEIRAAIIDTGATGKFANTSAANKFKAEGITEAVDAAYIDKFNALNNASTEKEITAILTTIGKTPNFDIKTARPEVYSAYIKAKDALEAKASNDGRPADALAEKVFDAKELQSLVIEQNNLFDVNSAKDTVALTKILASIASVKIPNTSDLTDKTTINANRIDYQNLSTEQKEEVAKLFTNDKVFGDGTNDGLYISSSTTRKEAYNKYTSTANVSADVKEIIDALYKTDTGVVSQINDACDGSNSTGTVTGAGTNAFVSEKLSLLHYAPYDDLTDEQKVNIAEKFLKKYPTAENQTTHKQEPVQDHFKTMAEIEAVIDSLLN